jgi:hypothetical protein
MKEIFNIHNTKLFGWQEFNICHCIQDMKIIKSSVSQSIGQASSKKTVTTGILKKNPPISFYLKYFRLPLAVQN